MNYVAERVIGYRAERVVDLRDRLARETDSQRRAELQTEIDRERRELALILLQDSKPELCGWEWFYVTRDEHGTLHLHFRHLRPPVNAAYLEHLLSQNGIRVPAKGMAVVNPSFAIDAIEEAVGQVNHDIAVTDDLKRRLIFYHRIAESLASQSDSEKACA